MSSSSMPRKYVSELWRNDDLDTHFSTGHGIAFDSAGNIYVSDGTA